MVEVLFPGDEGHHASSPEPPLTEKELRFRHHCRADDEHARSVSPEYAAWARKVRAEWLAAQPAPVERPKKQASKPKKAPGYKMKWQP